MTIGRERQRRFAGGLFSDPVAGRAQAREEESRGRPDSSKKGAKVTPNPKSSHAAPGTRKILSMGALVGPGISQPLTRASRKQTNGRADEEPAEAPRGCGVP